MSAITINVDTTAATAVIDRLRGGLSRRREMNGKIAADLEGFVKAYGRRISPNRHRTAERLGARPTNHLFRAYAAIESASDDESAILRVPRASRLRAAFGEYVVTPQGGKKYLTIPAHPDAYGRRAGEFDDLVFARIGPRMTPALIRETRTGEGFEVMFFLTRKATIKEDRTLLPFDELADEAADSIDEYLDTLTSAQA